MQIQLIRSATLRIEYATRTFIIDPYLAAKGTRPSVAGKSKNPLVDLPFPPKDVIAGIELAIISHLHSDHFDPDAQKLLPKETPILCQPGDELQFKKQKPLQKFLNVTPVANKFSLNGITITRTNCQHGTSDKVLKEMGNASGFIFQAEHEPTVYWAGDTILNETIKSIIAQTQPEIIVTHSCGAKWKNDLIVMDAAQTVAVCNAAPGIVIATHMDSVDHATVSRADLRQFAEINGVGPDKLLIPKDGEKLIF